MDIYRGSRAFIRKKSLAEHIDTYFPARSITLGTKETTKNVLSDLSFQHFSVDTVADCIFIEQDMSRFTDQVEFNSGDDPLGDMFVRGRYCALPSEPNKHALYRIFIASIGIYGFAVPYCE